jgi:hypothetical protein
MSDKWSIFDLANHHARWQRYCLRHTFQAKLFSGWYLVIIVATLMFLGPIASLWRPAPSQRPSYINQDLMKTVDSVYVPTDRRDNHIAEMTTVINQYLANGATLYSSWEASRIQLRSFFITLLVGLISVSYLRDTARPDLQRTLMTTAILVTIVMYGLDIHIVDVMNRNLVAGSIANNTIPSIIELRPDDSSWHYLDFSRIARIQDSLSQTHWSRKFDSTIHPTLEQCFIYLLPLALLGMKRASIRHTVT